MSELAFTEILIPLSTSDGATCSLWKLLTNNSQSNQNIFLTHGTYSDKRSISGIAKYLAKAGYTCWLMEWRAHGASPTTDTIYDYETIGLQEVKVVFDYFFQELQLEHIHTVQHSAGGILQTMCLIRNPQYISKIKCSVFFGSQAFSVGNNRWKKLQLIAAKIATKVMGGSAGQKTGKPHDESYYMMKQWFDWNIQGEFLGRDGLDYQQQMPKISIPILQIAAAGDTFVAPRYACQVFIDAFENPQNELLYVGKNTGYAEDYTHSRMVLSRNAEKEIYPQVLDWLREEK